ncbi:hypothetical protein JCM16303_001475 [Sporobolomyces ruberrimus]
MPTMASTKRPHRGILASVTTFLWVASTSSLIPLASTRSIRPEPLHPRAVSHPSRLSHYVVPRSTDSLKTREEGKWKRSRSVNTEELLTRGEPLPRWDDKFLLSFESHDEEEPVLLSLRPSKDLVHPNGIKSIERHWDESTETWKTIETRISREEVQVYEGWVVKNEGWTTQEEEELLEKWIKEETIGVVRDSSRWQEFSRGWARLSVHPVEEDGKLRFQGAYEKDGEMFTIHPTERYLKTRDELDPLLEEIRSRSEKRDGESKVARDVVIVRERDILTPTERINLVRKRGLPQLPDPETLSHSSSASCSHDSLSFNTDPSNPVLANALDQSVFAEFHSPWIPFLGLPSPSASSPFTPSDRSTALSPRSHGRSLHKRQSAGDISGGSGTSSNFINSIGSTQGCPKAAMVVFLGVAADCTYVESYSSSTDIARRQILDDINQVSALYQQSFNISIGVVELAVMGATCPTTASAVDAQNPWNLPCLSSAPVGGSITKSDTIGIDLNTRLSVFSQWRGDKGGGDSAGLWHLMTACQTSSEVGVAWLGQLCRVAATSQGGQTTSGTGVTVITRNEWQVVAHEIGHNFGAIHDCSNGCSLSGSCCPLSSSTCDSDANFIMSPVSEKTTTRFSPCSIGNICTAIGSSLNTTCIVDQGASSNPRIISEQSCGNGIVEDGEECDPGSADSACCDAATCRFRSGAVCDPLNSLCCTTMCQVAGSGTVCRASIDTRCDKEEVCDGSSSSCPKDEFESNGKGCGDGLSCASGVCTSRDLQCRNAGASLDITSACPTSANTGCSITCNDPTRRSGCIILDQSFRDGTSCGYGGRCSSGECQSGNALDTAKSWYTDNLRISIPVTIVVGIIVLLIIFAIIRCCCCGGRRRGGAAKPPRNQAFSSNYAPNGYGGGFQPPPMNQNGYCAPPPGPPPQAMTSNRLRR